MKEKKMKKLFSAIMAVAMAGSIAPSVLAEGTAIEETAKTFVEDFESYDVGTLPSFITIAGSTMTGSGVVDDGTGNKVFMLKYNRSASYSNAYINLGETFSDGAYNYDYKFKIVNADAVDWYDYFMAPWDGVNSKVVMQNKLSGTVQFYNSSVNEYSDIESLKDENGYYNMHQVFDFANKKVYPPMKNVYGASSDNLSNALQFDKLRFRCNHDSKNGVPTVTGDAENAEFAIIYIDDIEITPVEPIKMISRNSPIGGEVSKIFKNYSAEFNYDLASVSGANVKVKKDDAILTEGFSVAKAGKTLTVTFAEELTAGSEYKITATGINASNAMYGTSDDTVIAEFTAVEDTDSFIEDFEKYDIGALPLFVDSYNKDFAGSGVIDDGTGNKVFMLKYNRANSSYWQHLYMNLGQTFEGSSYNYDYKFKIVNSDGGDWYNNFMSLYNSENDKVLMQNKLASKVQFHNNTNNAYSDMAELIDGNGYYNIHQVFDLLNGKVYPPIANTAEASPTNLQNNLPFNKIRITTRHESACVPEVTGDPENIDYGIVYIDNIEITPIASIELAGKNTAIGSEVLNTNKEYKAFFNQNLGTVSAANVKVEKDGAEITEGFSVTKSADTLTVTFAEDLAVGGKYKITATGITASNAMYGTIKDTVIADFTARDKIDEFVEDFEDFEVGDKPYFVSIFGGNKMQAEVAADEAGNKVLKVTMDSENATQWYGMRIMLGNEFTMGSYNYDYDVKIVNAQAGRFQPFMQLQSYTTEKTVDLQNRTITMQKSDDGESIVPSFVFGNGYWVVAENLPKTNGYYNIDSVVDLDNRTQMFPLKDGTGRRHWVLEPTDRVADNPDTEENEAIPGTNSFNALYMKAIVYGDPLGFEAEEGSAYYSKTIDTYFIDNIDISPRRGLWKGEEKIRTVVDAKGNNVTAEIDMRDTAFENFTVIIALYDGNKLVEVKTVEKAELIEGFAKATLNVPEDAEALKLSYMIFDSLDGLYPIGGKSNF